MVMIPLLRVVMIPLLRSPSEHRFVHKKSASGLRGIPQVRKKLVPNFLFVWHVALCPTPGLCVLILHLVWMCADPGESTSTQSSLHMDLYTKVWFQ